MQPMAGELDHDAREEALNVVFWSPVWKGIPCQLFYVPLKIGGLQIDNAIENFIITVVAKQS